MGFCKLYKKLHSNSYLRREEYLSEAIKTIEQYEEVFASQPPILDVLEAMREKMK